MTNEAAGVKEMRKEVMTKNEIVKEIGAEKEVPNETVVVNEMQNDIAAEKEVKNEAVIEIPAMNEAETETMNEAADSKEMILAPVVGSMAVVWMEVVIGIEREEERTEEEVHQEIETLSEQ